MQIEEAIEILRKDILIDDCFINHELDVIFKESTKIAIDTVLNELEKKDKVIDEMAKMINNHDIDEDVCSQMGKDKHCNDYVMFEENCINCIKEYFYKKVSDNK